MTELRPFAPFSVYGIITLLERNLTAVQEPKNLLMVLPGESLVVPPKGFSYDADSSLNGVMGKLYIFPGGTFSFLFPSQLLRDLSVFLSSLSFKS